MAHENTKKRMSEPHDLIPLGLHFDVLATNALPQKTFKTSEKLDVNDERVAISTFPRRTPIRISIFISKKRT